MARPLRIEYPGAWYHTTSRGNERRPIFNNDKDRQKFLEILAISLETYKVELHAYVLMNNHFHLILKTPDANLQKFMQRFNTTYTVYFNRKHKRSGHLFQGRYKAILVEADSYLLELSRYVHLNPVRAKENSHHSFEEKLTILKNYKWSSYPGYIHMRRRQDFMSYGMILGVLGESDGRRGRRAYEQFVVEGTAKGLTKNMWEEVRGQALLGSESFVEHIYERFLSSRKADTREQPWIEDIRTISHSIEGIASHVARVFGIRDESELYQRKCSQRQVRSIFIELCRRFLIRKMAMAELGYRLGNISGAAISMNTRRLKKAMQSDKGLRKRFEKIVKELQARS